MQKHAAYTEMPQHKKGQQKCSQRTLNSAAHGLDLLVTAMVCDS